MAKIKIIIERLEDTNSRGLKYETILEEGNIFSFEDPFKEGLLALGFLSETIDSLFTQESENDQKMVLIIDESNNASFESLRSKEFIEYLKERKKQQERLKNSLSIN